MPSYKPSAPQPWETPRFACSQGYTNTVKVPPLSPLTLPTVPSLDAPHPHSAWMLHILTSFLPLLLFPLLLPFVLLLRPLSTGLDGLDFHRGLVQYLGPLSSWTDFFFAARISFVRSENMHIGDIHNPYLELPKGLLLWPAIYFNHAACPFGSRDHHIYYLFFSSNSLFPVRLRLGWTQHGRPLP